MNKIVKGEVLFPLGLAVALAVISWVPDAKANVYATSIKLNGGITNIAVPAGTNVTIGYRLNEAATSGTTIQISAGATLIRTISIAAGNPGALRGSNSVVWDGKDNSSQNAPSGIYSVSITAAAAGFTNWTQTSIDTNAGNYVNSPRGVAVNNNSNSPYYGRIFVGNAKPGLNPGTVPGDVQGILKVNADGTLADEGQSTGGYTWIDDSFNDSPHFLRYGQDDRIYAVDFTGTGVIAAFDMKVTTNQVVLDESNYANTPGSLFFGWSLMDVTDAGTTNGRLWLGDNDSPSIGVWTWQMTNGVANPSDTTGTRVIATGGDLSQNPLGGFMMDKSNNIFIAQTLNGSGNANNRAMVFTNWNGVSTLTNGTAWKVGANDNSFLGGYDLAIDSRANPKYVANALSISGGLRVLNATNGLVITNGTQVLTNLDSTNLYFGVAWDGVGNLYGVTPTTKLLRAFSPPGTNQATTLAPATVQVIGPALPPTITSISINGATVTINFTGSVSDTAVAFTLVNSSTVSGSYTPTGGANIVQLSAGVFQATAPTSGDVEFYRIKR